MDAFNFVVAGVLEQERAAAWHPVEYLSTKLSD
jgi:hypothetical protein